MTNRRNPASSSERGRKQHSMLSARKVALMASVVSGLAMSGFSPSSNHFDVLGSAAYAGTNNAVSSVAQPVVERLR